MRIAGLAIAERDEYTLVTVTAELKKGEELDANDVSRMLDIIREATTDHEPAADPKPARRRRGASTETATDTGETEKPKRRRRSAEPASEETSDPKPARRRRGAAAEEQATEEKPKRQRRTKSADDGISDEKLVKAASEAAETLGSDLVQQILKEDFDGCENVHNLDQDEREKFVATLEAELNAPE